MSNRTETCKHEAWEETGSWRKCCDCGYGWSARMTAESGAYVTTQTCVLVVCSVCGEHHHDEYTPHWDTLADAKVALDDWAWPDDATPICPSCRIEALCREEGHLWDPWMRSSYTGRWDRSCDRNLGPGSYGNCDGYESSPTPPNGDSGQAAPRG